MVFYCLGCVVSDEKSYAFLVFVFPDVWPSLATLEMFSLSLVVGSVIIIYTLVYISCAWGLLGLFNTWMYSFHQIWKSFDHYFFKHFFVSPSPLQGLQLWVIRLQGVASQLTAALCRVFCFLFSFHSFSLSNRPLILSSVFFISYVIVFISRSLAWVFKNPFPCLSLILHMWNAVIITVFDLVCPF